MTINDLIETLNNDRSYGTEFIIEDLTEVRRRTLGTGGQETTNDRKVSVVRLNGMARTPIATLSMNSDNPDQIKTAYVVQGTAFSEVPRSIRGLAL